MRGSAEVAKGRVEEAAGVLANSDKLRTRGRTNQVKGRVKQAAEAAVRHTRDAAGRIADKVKDVGRKTVDGAGGKSVQSKTGREGR